MSDQPVASRGSRAGRLAEVNTEPTEPAIIRVVTLLNAVMRPFTRRDWRRTERIPQTGGVVFAVNHISNVDPLAVGQFLAYSGRWPRYLAKASLFRVPLLGQVLRACGQIPVQRNSRAAGHALREAVTAVAAGRAIVVYPEGTITLDPDLWPMEGKTGAARIALEARCPVIPIGQWGAQEIMYGKRIHLPRLWPPKTLHLLVGDPVPLDDLRAQTPTSLVLTEATDRIMTAITALVAELREADPPARRLDPRSAGPDAGEGGR